MCICTDIRYVVRVIQGAQWLSGGVLEIEIEGLRVQASSAALRYVLEHAF